MKKTIKTLAALFVPVFAAIMFSVMASAEEYTGYCGDPSVNDGKNVSWHFDSVTEQLTISGGGDMADYVSGTDAPWHEYAEAIRTIIFAADITSIGDNAFNGTLYGAALSNIAFRGPAPEDIGSNAFAAYLAEYQGVVHVPAEYAEGYEDIVSDLSLDAGDDAWMLTSAAIEMPFEIKGLRLPMPIAGADPDEIEVIYDSERWYDLAYTQWFEVVEGGNPIGDPDYFEEGKDYFIIVGVRADAETFPEYTNAFYEYCYNGVDLSGFFLPGLNAGVTFSTISEHWGDGGNAINLQFGFEGSYITPSAFVPVTDISDVPDEAAVGETLTLRGTVVPEAAARQITYWEMVDSRGGKAELTVDPETNLENIFTATEPGTYTVRAVVERGHSIEGDPAIEDNYSTPWLDESRDFWKDFTITVDAPAAPAIDGPASMTVTEGYEAVSTPAFELTGWPTPTVIKLSDNPLIVWNGAMNKLDIAPGLTQGDYEVALKASNGTGSDEFTFTLTVKPLGTVTGEIDYEHNDPPLVVVPDGHEMDVRVYLTQNGEPVPNAVSELRLVIGEDVSAYVFTDVADGWYTVVADAYEKDTDNLYYTITRDVYMGAGTVKDPPERIVFTPGKTQTVLAVDGETPAKNVATNDLPDLFGDYYGLDASNPFSAEDKTLLNSGGTIEYRMAAAAAEDADKNALEGAIPPTLDNVLFLDLTLSIARIEAGGVSVARISLNDVYPALMEIVVPLPPELIGKTIKAVYRTHGGITEPITGTPNAKDEYFRFDSSRNTVYLYVNQFSAYAFAVDAPVRNSGGSENPYRPAAGLTLNKDKLSLISGESETLIATVTPSDVSDKRVTWTSGDPSVATVDGNGKVTAVKPGLAVITARSNSGGYTDTCVVTVRDSSQVFIAEHTAYIVGYPDGTVGPNDSLTRAEAATVFFRLLTEEIRAENWTRDNAFTDISEDNWHNNAVSVMSRMGIMEGYSDGTFRPDVFLTRAELAAVTARFARDMGKAGANKSSFSDIDGNFAAADIQYAASVGWINGYTDGTFRPDQNITRAEFMALVNRMLGRIPESTADLQIKDTIIWPDNADTADWYYIAVQEATNSHEAEYKDTMVSGLSFYYERWTEILPNRDWAELEKTWSAANPR